MNKIYTKAEISILLCVQSSIQTLLHYLHAVLLATMHVCVTAVYFIKNCTCLQLMQISINIDHEQASLGR